MLQPDEGPSTVLGPRNEKMVSGTRRRRTVWNGEQPENSRVEERVAIMKHAGIHFAGKRHTESVRFLRSIVEEALFGAVWKPTDAPQNHQTFTWPSQQSWKELVVNMAGVTTAFLLAEFGNLGA